MIPIAAITDEFSPDLDIALPAMASVGMTGAELRVISGKNIINCTDEEVDRVRATIEARGMKILGIASPVLKCDFPGQPPSDLSIQRDVFAAAFTFEDQPRLARRAFEIAERTGAKIIRVFSYWRSLEPDRCVDAIATALRGLADQAAARGLIIGLENEHACNVATGVEAARVLAAVDHPALKLIWDPANAVCAGEKAFPDGYAALPKARIVHVHAKDCIIENHKPTWGPLGEMSLDWKGQVSALARDGYKGWISLETHWPGPGGDKLQGSIICGRNLSALVGNPS